MELALHLFFNDLKLTNKHTHRCTHIHASPLNLCLLKWSLMRCEQRTTTLSLPPSSSPTISSSLSLITESDYNRQTELQRHRASDAWTGGGRKVMLELMGENEVFFSVSLLHPSIHHHVITARADHKASEAYFFLFGNPTYPINT